MNIFRKTKWTLQARKEEITRAKRHKLRLQLERLDTRVQASSSILGAVWGMLIADAFGRDSEENPLALSNLLQNEAAKIASESSIAAQVAAPDIQPNRAASSQANDSVPVERDLKQTVTTDVPLPDASDNRADDAPSLAASLKLLEAGVPLAASTQDPPTAAEIDSAMTLTLPSAIAGAASGSSGGAGMPHVGSVGDAPAGAAFSATTPAVPGTSGGGGPSVTLSDDVPEVQGSADGEETVASEPTVATSFSGTDAAENETLLEPTAGTGDTGTMSFTGCGCGTPPCVTRENWCPMCGGSHDENLLSEVFLDYYDDNSYYDGDAQNDDIQKIRLPHFFADNDQAACTLGYAVHSNSDLCLVDASISTNCAGIPFLDLEALDSPGVADVVVRGTDGDGMYADWGIKVYAVEVTGFVVEERAWAEAQWNGPEDSDQCGSSDATWNVLWGADSHRWTPTVAPSEAQNRVVMHGLRNENGDFAHADWCQAPPSADYGGWDRWAYGTPSAQGETKINPQVTFSALDVDALLSRNAYVRIKTDPEPEDAPQISLHTISAEHHDGLEWERVSPAETTEVPALCQDLSFAELADTTDRPYWAVFPTTGTVDYDVVEVKVRITPAIPAGRKGDVHLAWYDPLNTVANVSSTPPTTNSANTVRDNHQDAELTPLTGKTVTFEEDMDEESAYYRINTPRFGDNYIVAAHPRDGFETGYYFDGCGCGCGSTEEFLHYDDYPEGTNCGVNPGHPDFTAPLVDALLTPNKQTPTLNILPSVDIDIDSDNNGTIERSELEEKIETTAPGKVIKLNIDDDDENGTPDREDDGPYTEIDDDLVPAKLSYDDVDADLTGMQLKLSHGAGVKLWTTQKKDAPLPLEYTIGLDTIPTTFYVEGTGTGQANIKATLEVPDSMGFITLHIDEVMTTVIDFTVPRLKSLVFDDIGVKTDPSEETGISPTASASRYGQSHHWYDHNVNGIVEPSADDLKIPVAYVQDTTPDVTAVFSIAQPDGTPASTLEIRGTATGGIAFPVVAAQSNVDGSYTYQAQASSAFPEEVKHYDDFIINWETRIPGGDWQDAGTSANDLYLTLAAPAADLYHTTLHLGSHYGAGSTTESEVIQSVWSHFTDLGIQKQDETSHIGSLEIVDAGDPLTYWADYANSGAGNTSTLLHDLNGNCGSFADIFAVVMKNQGIDPEKEVVQITTAIFVNSWQPNGPQINGNDVMVFVPLPDDDGSPGYNDRLSDAMYSSTRDRYVLNQHTQLSDLQGLPGQNESNPRAHFGMGSGHTFVRYAVNGQMRWFDPSYGVEYVGANDAAKILDFEDKSLYGTIQPELSDIEIVMGVDLDGDGAVTTEANQTSDLIHKVVKRQDPNAQDVQFFFKEAGT